MPIVLTGATIFFGSRNLWNLLKLEAIIGRVGREGVAWQISDSGVSLPIHLRSWLAALSPNWSRRFYHLLCNTARFRHRPRCPPTTTQHCRLHHPNKPCFRPWEISCQILPMIVCSPDGRPGRRLSYRLLVCPKQRETEHIQSRHCLSAGAERPLVIHLHLPHHSPPLLSSTAVHERPTPSRYYAVGWNVKI